jgi:hypothetical protein
MDITQNILGVPLTKDSNTVMSQVERGILKMSTLRAQCRASNDEVGI